MRKTSRIIIRPIGFPPIVEDKNRPPKPEDLPVADRQQTVEKWLEEMPNEVPIDESLDFVEKSEEERKEVEEYEKTFRPGPFTGRSSWVSTSTCESQTEEVTVKMEDLTMLPTPEQPADDDNNNLSDIKKEITEEERANLSLEIRDMDTDDNKFEPSEFVEYKDHSWCIALLVQDEPNPERTMYKRTMLSYQSGIQRIDLPNDQKETAPTAVLFKYRHTPGGHLEVLPIYSSLAHTNLINYRTRVNKAVELDVYGVFNFVDIVKDPNHMNYRSMVWTDAAGAVYLTAAQRSNFRRKLNLIERKAFAPLRMCKLKIVAEFAFNVPDGYVPKWNVVSMHPMMEEEATSPSIGRNFWPARLLRFDDLHVTGSDANGTWLKSYSKPKVVVFAGPNLAGVLNSAGADYFKNGIMSAVVAPFFMKDRFAYYDALVAGPLRVLAVLTEGRILNFCPKTWPPSIRREWLKHRNIHDRKEWVRAKPKSPADLAKSHISPTRPDWPQSPTDLVKDPILPVIRTWPLPPAEVAKLLILPPPSVEEF